jgi:hypothetical protein
VRDQKEYIEFAFRACQRDALEEAAKECDIRFRYWKEKNKRTRAAEARDCILAIRALMPKEG